jgi:hypothetical protein
MLHGNSRSQPPRISGVAETKRCLREVLHIDHHAVLRNLSIIERTLLLTAGLTDSDLRQFVDAQRLSKKR